GLTSATVHMTVHVNPDRLADLSNTATLTTPTPYTTLFRSSNTTSTTVNTAADLHIAKSDSPDPVLAGNNLTYTVTVTNSGPSFASNRQHSYTAPTSTSLIPADTGGNESAGTVSWSLGDLGL